MGFLFAWTGGSDVLRVRKTARRGRGNPERRRRIICDQNANAQNPERGFVRFDDRRRESCCT